MKTHIVTKQLPVGDKVYEPGEEVDASEWRYARLLVEQRYLKPLDGVASDPQSVTVTESDEFRQRIIDIVAANIREDGELAQMLAQLIQPNGRDKRMGRKEEHANNRN